MPFSEVSNASILHWLIYEHTTFENFERKPANIAKNYSKIYKDDDKQSQAIWRF